MDRRYFMAVSASLLLPAIARAGSKGGDGIVAGAANVTSYGDGMQQVQTADERAILRLGKSAFLISPNTDISFEVDKAGMHVRAANGDAALTQKTTYHEARVITENGTIDAAPYQVPLNHYDNSLVRLEAVVGRTPRWILPNGKLNFISPFEV